MTQEEVNENNKLIAEFMWIPCKLVKFTTNPDDPRILEFGFPGENLPPGFYKMEIL